MTSSSSDSEDIHELFKIIKELLDAHHKELVDNDSELIRELWQVLNFKLGIDEKSLNEVSSDFELRHSNYQKLYNAIKEQMKVMEEIKAKRE